MRKSWIGPNAAAAMVLAYNSAQAGTYIPVPMVPGAVSEIVFSINNKNIVAGSYRDVANVEHGFFGPLDGSNWTSFDAPFEGTTGTEPRYISDDGAITGIALKPTFKVGEEFYRTPNGRFKIFRAKGKKLDGIAQGLTKHNNSVGDYILTRHRTIGYLAQGGRFLDVFRLHLKGNKGFFQISPRGVTETGAGTAGLFVDHNHRQHGFIQFDEIGEKPFVMVFDYAAAVSTGFEDISDSFVAPGQWVDADNNTHAFTLNVSDGNFEVTDIDPQDGSTSQQAWGINDHGFVAVSTNMGKSYIYCPKKNSDKCPAGFLTMTTIAIPKSHNLGAATAASSSRVRSEVVIQ
jgi:hypothetical protein